MILSADMLKLPISGKWAAPSVGDEGEGPTGPELMTPTVAPVLYISTSESEPYLTNLYWDPSDKTDSEGFAYTLQTRFNGGSWVTEYAWITDTFYVMNAPNAPIPNGLYEFRVFPHNHAGNGPMSQVVSFTVDVEEVVDPIAGLFNRLRLQTLRSKDESQVAGYRDCLVVTGAGSADVNGRYYAHEWSGADVRTWMHESGAMRIEWWDNAGWWIHNSWSANERYWAGGGSITVLPQGDSGMWMTVGSGLQPFPMFEFTQETLYAAVGINPVEGGANATWTDAMSATGEASQSNAIQRYITQYEWGVPVLVGDGADDWMTTPVLTSDLDARGALFGVFRVNTGAALNVHSVIGGANMGCAFANNMTNSEWGLYKPGGWTARFPISTPSFKWVSFVATWEGVNFRYHCVSEGVNEAKSGVLPNTYSTNAVANIGIGTRRSNNILSYFPGRYIAVGIGDQYLSAADVQRAAEYGASLFPSL